VPPTEITTAAPYKKVLVLHGDWNNYLAVQMDAGWYYAEDETCDHQAVDAETVEVRDVVVGGGKEIIARTGGWIPHVFRTAEEDDCEAETLTVCGVGEGASPSCVVLPKSYRYYHAEEGREVTIEYDLQLGDNGRVTAKRTQIEGGSEDEDPFADTLGAHSLHFP
jgi:hypothetical protein